MFSMFLAPHLCSSLGNVIFGLVYKCTNFIFGDCSSPENEKFKTLPCFI